MDQILCCVSILGFLFLLPSIINVLLISFTSEGLFWHRIYSIFLPYKLVEITHSCVTTLLRLFVVSIVSIGEGGVADIYSLSPIIEVDPIGKINKKYRTTMSSMSPLLRLIHQWTGWDSRPVVRL